MNLTKEQKESVLTIEGNVVCVASAGSGKTSAFTTRIAHMIKNENISPFNIMAVTFTKKATEEMKSRLNKLIGKDLASKVAMGTFHSLAYRLLKALDPDFSKYHICPDWWKFSLLNDMCKIATDKNPNGLNLRCKAGELASFISYQKANMIRPSDDLLFDDNVDYIIGTDRVLLRQAYEKFERLKEESRQVDFDDMLLMLYERLTSNKEFRERLQSQYKYIMIDEGQDTSLINKEIVKLINDKNVYMVGDFRQSIYSFINARVDNILDFKHEFNDVKVIELNKNFRSTQNIVNFSNDIIKHSPIEKYNLFKPSESVGDVGDKVNFTLYDSEDTQFDTIANQIQKLHADDNIQLSEMAVLVRTNAQTAIIEDILADRDIPYIVNKSQSFFDRKEVLDILSYARLALDLNDDVSFRRIYNSPNRYLGKQFIEELDRFSNDINQSLFHSLKKFPKYSEWKYKRNIDSLYNVVDGIKGNVDNMNAGKFLRSIVSRTKYIEHMNNTVPNVSSLEEKRESVDRICSMASKFPTVRAFLAHIGKIKDKQKKSEGKDAVNIVTIHSSKGLEWDAVFVPNLNDGLLPHTMNNDDEEERRLFYVASSRARIKLFISWYMYDEDYSVVKESMFIQELIGKKKVEEMIKDIFRENRMSTILYK